MQTRYYLDHLDWTPDGKAYAIRDSRVTNAAGNHKVILRFADIAKAAFVCDRANGVKLEVGDVLPVAVA